MKEFVAQTGGRYTYIDDILNLQELSLAMTHLFDGCDDFVLSGCMVSGTSLSKGFVYINGKIRYFEGIESTTFPVYIYEKNSIENVPYADSVSKEGCKIYGCGIATEVPTSIDPITGMAPAYITITNEGKTRRVSDAFFARYAVTLNDALTNQVINKNLLVNGAVHSKSNKVSNSYVVESGNQLAHLKYNNNTLDLSTSNKGGQTHKLSIKADGTIEFYNADTQLFQFNTAGARAFVPFRSKESQLGNITIKGNDIYDTGTATDKGSVKINMLSANGGGEYYRDFIVGDGKGNILMQLEGDGKSAYMYTSFSMVTDKTDALILKHATLAKNDKAAQMTIGWTDKNNDLVAHIGFAKNTDRQFYIRNVVGGIVLDNDTYVVGKLYVNNTNIEEVLYSKTEAEGDLALKADKTNVYSKTDTDSLFVKNTDIAIFVEKQGGGSTGMDKVCQALGATRTTETLKYAKKDQLFKDIVSEGLAPDSPTFTEEQVKRQKELCVNIGAAYKNDLGHITKDTKWINVTGNTMKVRQMGQVVSVAGDLTVDSASGGSLFTLPEDIDAPSQNIGVYLNHDAFKFEGSIKAGERICKGTLTGSGYRGQVIPFILTYLI